jgi:uncharacterized cupredoxin-like copper-binding protein
VLLPVSRCRGTGRETAARGEKEETAVSITYVRGAAAAVSVVAAAAVAGTALAGGSASTAQATTTVNVVAGKPSEFHFRLNPKAGKKGVVVFRVVNDGKTTHDFKVKGRVTRHLAPGKSATIRITFAKAGSYQYLCTLPGHAAAGMKGVFKVS